MKVEKLTKNISANLLAQIYTMLVGMIFFPLYLKYLGAESYGLVGFFSTMQSICALIDVGFSQSVSRYASKLHSESIDYFSFKDKYKGILNKVNHIAIAMFITAFLWILFFSTKWFNIHEISTIELYFALGMIFTTVIIRWKSAIYRGVFLGFEEMYFYSFQLGLISTLRFILVIPVLLIFGKNIVVFFLYQFFVSIFELIFLKKKSEIVCNSKKDINLLNKISLVDFNEPKMKSLWAASFLVLMFSQLDKLLLSGTMALKDYGYFSLAVLLSSVVIVISYPISSSTMYNMLKFFNMNQTDKFIESYVKSTVIILSIVGASAITLFYYSENILQIWTRDSVAVQSSYEFLKLYAIGNLFFVLSLVPYQIQFAKGDLKVHIGQFSFLLIFYASLIFLFKETNVLIIMYSWVILNVLSFIIGSYCTHFKLLPSFRFRWVAKILLVLIINFLFGKGFYLAFDGLGQNVVFQVLKILLMGIFLLGLFIMFSWFLFKNDFINKHEIQM